jgi:hypothetical protein
MSIEILHPDIIITAYDKATPDMKRIISAIISAKEGTDSFFISYTPVKDFPEQPDDSSFTYLSGTQYTAGVLMFQAFKAILNNTEGGESIYKMVLMALMAGFTDEERDAVLVGAKEANDRVKNNG